MIKRNNTVRDGIIASVVLAMILAGAFILGRQHDAPEPEVQTPVSEAKAIFYSKVNDTLSMIQNQENVDQQLSSMKDDNTFTIDDPYILVNPYKISPLTAIVYFYTETDTVISIQIEGTQASTSLVFSDTVYDKNHWIPVYGLYAGRMNQVMITATDHDGVSKSSKLQIETEPLNDSLSTNIINTFYEDTDYETGFTFSYSNGHYSNKKTAFDQEGEYRWYLTKEWAMAGSYNHGDSVFTGYGDIQGEILILEMSYLGRIKAVYYSPYGMHHDVFVTDQKLLVTGSNNVPDTIEDFIYSIDRRSGKVQESLDYKNILLRTRHIGVNYLLKDWMHINSIVEFDDKLIVSSNYQNLIIKNDWEGNIDWIFGDPTGFTTKYQKLLLKPIGDYFEYPYNQHNVTVLPDSDHDPKTLDLLVFDNGASRNEFNNSNIEKPLYSRIVIYRIDESAHTVRQLWQYGKERLELYASARGGATLLNNGNILAVFPINEEIDEVKTNHAVYVEVDMKDKVIWEATASSSSSSGFYVEYKAERYVMYTPVTYQLELDKKASVFLPDSLIEELNQYNQSIASE